jgi:hypothetical protein
MRILIIILLFEFIVPLQSFAQITVESERDKDGNVTIFANNSQPIPYSVMLNFTILENLTSSGGRVLTAIAIPGRSQLTRLRLTQEGQGTNLNYSFSFAKGNVFGKNKTAPIFLIPVAEGLEVTAMQMTHIENNLGADRSNDDYVGVSFAFKEPTQIVAPRKGIIAEIKMETPGEKNNLAFAKSENHIEIYHEDGTITQLIVFKYGSERVKVGDQVYPGDVLAESSGENYNAGPHVRMRVLKTVKDGPEKLKYEVIPVSFATSEGSIEVPKFAEWVVVHPQEVVVMEMTKKELKNYFSEK